MASCYAAGHHLPRGINYPQGEPYPTWIIGLSFGRACPEFVEGLRLSFRSRFSSGTVLFPDRVRGKLLPFASSLRNVSQHDGDPSTEDFHSISSYSCRVYTIQALPGHHDVNTTMIYTHVLIQTVYVLEPLQISCELPAYLTSICDSFLYRR